MSAPTEALMIRCPACNATNRVPREKLDAQHQPVCGRCKTPLPASASPVVVTDATFASDVEGSPVPVLVDLWAPWCGPCRMLTPVMEQLAAELAGRIRIAKLNVDENPQTSGRFDVRSIPTMLIFKDGRMVERLVGAMPKSEILRHLQALL
jgi:thioredoxin 2